MPVTPQCAQRGTHAERQRTLRTPVCQDRALRAPHQWHATPWRPAKPSQSAMSRAPGEPSLTRPGASVPRAGAVAHAPRTAARVARRATVLLPVSGGEHAHTHNGQAAPRRSGQGASRGGGGEAVSSWLVLCCACTARCAALTHTQTQAGAIAEATASDLAFLKACKLVGAKTNLQSNVQV